MPFDAARTLNSGSAAHLSDHNGFAALLNTLENAGRGIVASNSRTTNLGLTTSMADVTGLSVTFTTVAGRRYRCSSNMKLNIYESNSGASYAGIVETQLLMDANVVDFDHIMGNQLYLGNNDKSYLEYVTLTAPTAASHTWKVQARYTDSTAPGSILASATQPAYIILEDIGV